MSGHYRTNHICRTVFQIVSEVRVLVSFLSSCESQIISRYQKFQCSKSPAIFLWHIIGYPMRISLHHEIRYHRERIATHPLIPGKSWK